MTQLEVMPDLTLVETDTSSPKEREFLRCAPWLESALGEGGAYTMADVARAVAMDRAQLWPGKNAAMVTEIESTNTKRFVRVWLAGGDLQELLDMAKGIESWARMQGCDYVAISGRKGWEKAAKSIGYEFESITLRKVL